MRKLKWVINMLTAKQNNQLVDLTQIPKKELAQLKLSSNYECPYCGSPVIFKQGPKRRAHFSHITPCDYDRHTHESEAHQRSKLVLSQWLINQGATSVQLEYRLSAVNRIADIYFERNDISMNKEGIVSDKGDGTFNNPLIFADVPDEDIIRVGDTYYMISTTKHLSPGVPIMKSYFFVTEDIENEI